MLTKSEALQNQLNEIDLKIQQAGNLAERNQLEAQRNDLINQLQVALTEELEQRERLKAQTEAVESIVLPLDFNDLLDNPLANEMIIEVVRQFQLQAYDEHNAEVARINAAHAEMLGVLTQAGTDNAAKYRECLQALENDLYQLGLEKAEAETARDNAARLLLEANEEIEKHKQSTIENCELRKQIEDLKQELTAKKALTVGSNDKLVELAAKAKESTAAAAQRGIDRWNQQYGLDIPTLAIPEIAPVNDVVPEVEAPAQEIPFPIQAIDNGADQEATGNTSLEQVVATEESEVVTLESLKAEVEAIKTYLGIAA